MIVDTSALVAILRREPEAERFTEVLLTADSVEISTGTLLEAQIVAMAYRSSSELAELLELIGANVLPFDERQGEFAADGFMRFGMGRHPAGLNIGDCFACGAARATGEALLCKANDFSKTDVPLA